MQLSSTAQALYDAMSETGTLLPSYMVTDNNRAAQLRRLSLIAGMVGMARHAFKELPIEVKLRIYSDFLFNSFIKTFK